jgi:hypothetical protein
MSKDIPTPRKSENPVNFRAGALRPEMLRLLHTLRERDPFFSLSDLLRESFTAFWPQISAYLIARQQAKIDPKQLSRLTHSCARALERGVTVAEVDAQLCALLELKQAMADAQATGPGHEHAATTPAA